MSNVNSIHVCSSACISDCVQGGFVCIPPTPQQADPQLIQKLDEIIALLKELKNK